MPLAVLWVLQLEQSLASRHLMPSLTLRMLTVVNKALIYLLAVIAAIGVYYLSSNIIPYVFHVGRFVMRTMSGTLCFMTGFIIVGLWRHRTQAR